GGHRPLDRRAPGMPGASRTAWPRRASHRRSRAAADRRDRRAAARCGTMGARAAGRRPFRPNRDDNPLAFRFQLALYYCGGAALAVWGLLALKGVNDRVAAIPIALGCMEWF